MAVSDRSLPVRRHLRSLSAPQQSCQCAGASARAAVLAGSRLLLGLSFHPPFLRDAQCLRRVWHGCRSGSALEGLAPVLTRPPRPDVAVSWAWACFLLLEFSGPFPSQCREVFASAPGPSRRQPPWVPGLEARFLQLWKCPMAATASACGLRLASAFTRLTQSPVAAEACSAADLAESAQLCLCVHSGSLDTRLPRSHCGGVARKPVCFGSVPARLHAARFLPAGRLVESVFVSHRDAGQ